MSLDLVSSQLHDEKTFYQTFLSDLKDCQQELVIESPFITSERMKTFDRFFAKLIEKGVKVYIITRDPREHEAGYDEQSEEVISYFERIGVQVLLCTGNHHRKLAIIDRKILWEGSLNILSQAHSREIMRRIDGAEMAIQMFDFLNLKRFI